MSISFKSIENQGELEKVYLLRERIFIEEDGYPIEYMKHEQDSMATHFIALKKKNVVGTISTILDGPHGLPSQKFIDLSPFRDKKIAEIYKLAVVPEERGGVVPAGLMVLAYEFLKECGAKRILISTLESKEKAIRLYQNLGFNIITSYKFYKLGNAVSMILDIDDCPYEKDPEKDELRRFFISNKLSKMLSSVFKIKSL